jgi:hypothetical protein
MSNDRIKRAAANYLLSHRAEAVATLTVGENLPDQLSSAEAHFNETMARAKRALEQFVAEIHVQRGQSTISTVRYDEEGESVFVDGKEMVRGPHVLIPRPKRAADMTALTGELGFAVEATPPSAPMRLHAYATAYAAVDKAYSVHVIELVDEFPTDESLGQAIEKLVEARTKFRTER